MDSAANMLAVHGSNKSMWETTDDDNIGLLVGEDDLIFSHFATTLLEELEDEYDYMYDLDQTSNMPMVKTVEEEHMDKFVFNDAEELFPSTHIEPTLQPPMYPTKPVFNTPEAEQDTDIKHYLQHDNQVTPEREKEKFCPDFLLSKV